MEPAGEYTRVGLKDCEFDIYFPRYVTAKHIFQVIAEQAAPWQWHYYQIPVTKVRCEDVVFDCGAAEGLFSAMTASVAREVHAFEPLPLFVEGLKRSFNGVSNVIIVPSALADKPGVGFLSDKGICSQLGATNGIKVDIDTVDDYCQRTGVLPTYIKADLEGAEMLMLTGAQETIKAARPRIAITTYHVENHLTEIKALLNKLHPGYRFKHKGIERRRNAPVMLHAW